MSYTLQYIRGRVRSRIGEVQGAPSWGDPETLDDLIFATADQICWATDCYSASYSADFTAGTTGYCLPQLKIKSITVYDSGGNACAVGLLTPAEFDCLYGVTWRGPSAATGVPQWAILGGPSGANELRFYPVPNYTTSGSTGFQLEGYGKPGRTWSTDMATCPLTDAGVEAVIAGAALKRARQFQKDYGSLLPELKAEYAECRAMVEREVVENNDAARHADMRGVVKPLIGGIYV